MAHEPKLEVYKIYLNPTRTTNDNSFQGFLEKKFPDVNFDKKKAYQSLFQELLSAIDLDYVLNETNKKGLRIDDVDITDPARPTKSIKIKSSKHIIHGTIKGGRYGQNRSIGYTRNPGKKKTKISTTDIVLDTFYFLLYTPFGSNKGVLIIQSYTDDQINDVFIDWLRTTFRTEGFFKPSFNHYCPSKIQQEFKKTSAIKELKFTNDILISDIDTDESIRTESFTISVTIRSNEDGEKISNLSSFTNMAKKLIFGNKRNPLTLEEFKRQVGTLYNGSHQSSFELGGEIDIKPTIFLKDKVELQADGSPKWSSLETFCLELLEEIKTEVYPESNEIS